MTDETPPTDDPTPIQPPAPLQFICLICGDSINFASSGWVHDNHRRDHAVIPVPAGTPINPGAGGSVG